MEKRAKTDVHPNACIARKELHLQEFQNNLWASVMLFRFKRHGTCEPWQLHSFDYLSPWSKIAFYSFRLSLVEKLLIQLTWPTHIVLHHWDACNLSERKQEAPKPWWPLSTTCTLYILSQYWDPLQNYNHTKSSLVQRLSTGCVSVSLAWRNIWVYTSLCQEK